MMTKAVRYTSISNYQGIKSPGKLYFVARVELLIPYPVLYFLVGWFVVGGLVGRVVNGAQGLCSTQS